MDRNLVSVFANLGSGPCLFKVGKEYELLLASIGEHTHVEDGHLTLPPDGFAIVSAEKSKGKTAASPGGGQPRVWATDERIRAGRNMRGW